MTKKSEYRKAIDKDLKKFYRQEILRHYTNILQRHKLSIKHEGVRFFIELDGYFLMSVRDRNNNADLSEMLRAINNTLSAVENKGEDIKTIWVNGK